MMGVSLLLILYGTFASSILAAGRGCTPAVLGSAAQVVGLLLSKAWWLVMGDGIRPSTVDHVPVLQK